MLKCKVILYIKQSQLYIKRLVLIGLCTKISEQFLMTATTKKIAYVLKNIHLTAKKGLPLHSVKQKKNYNNTFHL